MIKQSILDFPKQLAYEPEIINGNKLANHDKFVVVGMGGSHLAADLIKVFEPSIDLTVHTSYGLPSSIDLKDHLIILSSYSGNTEEVIDAFNMAMKMKLQTAVIAMGGKLLELAKINDAPYVQLPDMELQPRMALGLSLMALLKIVDKTETLSKVSAISKKLKPVELEVRGKELAQRLKGLVPIIYSSQNNSCLAYNWKVKFNENSKTPAFYNTLPELNHNEMEGFGGNGPNNGFYAIFLRDPADDPRILRRMDIIEKLYNGRGLKTEMIDLGEGNLFKKIFDIIILGDWAAYHLALIYGVNPETVPMVEEFKKLI